MKKKLLILLAISTLMFNGLIHRTSLSNELSVPSKNLVNYTLVQSASNQEVQKELDKLLTYLQNRFDLGFGKNYYVEKLKIKDILAFIKNYVIAINEALPSKLDKWSGNIGPIVKQADNEEFLIEYLQNRKTSPNIKLLEETDIEMKYTINVNFINLSKEQIERESETELANDLKGTLTIHGTIVL